MSRKGMLRQGGVGFRRVPGEWVALAEDQELFVGLGDEERFVDVALLVLDFFQIEAEMLGKERVGGEALGQAVVVFFIPEMVVFYFVGCSVEPVDVLQVGELDLGSVLGPVVAVGDDKLRTGSGFSGNEKSCKKRNAAKEGFEDPLDTCNPKLSRKR